MASPETDSGFVGSETSRVSPLTQTPEHRLSHLRYPGGPTLVPSVPHPWDSTDGPASPEQGLMVWAFLEPSLISPTMLPCPPLIDGGTEVQRGNGTCSHSVTEREIRIRLANN